MTGPSAGSPRSGIVRSASPALPVVHRIGPDRLEIVTKNVTAAVASRGCATACKRSPPPDAGRALADATTRALHAQQRMGWQPSRFLTDRAEAERTYRLAERLGSMHAAAAELGPPGRRCAKPSPATASVCRRVTLKRPPAHHRRASQCAGPPAAPPLDPVFMALNPGQLSTPRGPNDEQGCGCAGLRRSRRSATAPWWS